MICYMDDGTVVKNGTVKSSREVVYGVVDFDDGTFSDNLEKGKF